MPFQIKAGRFIGRTDDEGADRQIAQQLFLSVNTVETHLANVYRKLGIQRAGSSSPTLTSIAG
jgi:hypothetical protein